jgi:hypothetical protein
VPPDLALRSAPDSLDRPALLPPEAKLEAPIVLEVVQAASTTKAADEPAVLQALRSLIDKRPDDALHRLNSYDRSNQELLLFLLPLVVRLSEAGVQPLSAQDMTVALEELNSLMISMRARAALTIDNICFCKRIDAFGVYEPLPSDFSFRPSDMVQVYVEIKNFTSRKSKNQSGETRQVVDLKSSAEIRDYAGNRVGEPIDFERTKPDESRTVRHDYFDNYRFSVPELPPGAYTLFLQVEDRGTQPPRVATRTLDFRVTNLPVRGS